MAQLSTWGRSNVLYGPDPCIFSGNLKLKYIKGNSSITFVGDNIAVASHDLCRALKWD
jgi:hypothetical protein